MTTDIRLYTPLSTVVAYAQDELNKSMGDSDKMWLLGLRCLTHLQFQILGQTTTVRLPVAANKTVALPPNCLSWTKIGLLNEKGEIVTLKINNSLTTFRDTNPNRLGDLTADINNDIGVNEAQAYYSNFYYGGNCYQLFGVGNGVISYGECRVDEKNRVIILPPDFQYAALMVEFIDAPEKNADYEVPTCMQEAIIAFIKWKLKEGSREEFYAAATEGRRSLPNKKVHLQTLNQVIRMSDGMKLKA